MRATSPLKLKSKLLTGSSPNLTHVKVGLMCPPIHVTILATMSKELAVLRKKNTKTFSKNATPPPVFEVKPTIK